MPRTWFQRLALGAAGAIAFGVGSAILADPAAFYAGYGIRIDPAPDLRNELRAPGANLAALGALIFVGAVRSNWTRASALLGTTVFLAFAFGRAVSMALDGPPSDGLIHAFAIEVLVGALCVAAFLRSRERAAANGSSQATV